MEIELILKKLENLESEINSIKNIINPKQKKATVSLKGTLKGLKITEEDIKNAQKSLFHLS